MLLIAVCASVSPSTDETKAFERPVSRSIMTLALVTAPNLTGKIVATVATE
jgi:hypothetical protein